MQTTKKALVTGITGQDGAYPRHNDIGCTS